MGVQINGSEGNVIATKGTYSGNVTIGGTLTYEDVTNIDSVGLVTARNGIEIGARPGVAASVSVDGNAIFSGITTIGGVINANSNVNLSNKIIGIGTNGKIGIGTNVVTDGTIIGEIVGSASQRPRIQFNNKPALGSNDGELGGFMFRNDNDSVAYISIKRESAADDAYIQFSTQATGGSLGERLRIDSKGMIGFGGVTPKTQNTFDAIEFGKTGFLGSQTAARTVEIASNAYYNSGWKYKEADVASQYYQYQGYHAFTSAVSGSADGAISFVDRLRIAADGKIGIGLVSPKTDLDIANDAGGTLTLSCSDDSSSADQLIGKINFHTADPSGDGPQNNAIISAHSVESTGSGAYLKFSTATGATGSEGADAVERLRISKEGYVTKPNTPAFAVGMSASRVAVQGWQTIQYDDEHFDNGSHFDTSTHRFTAPVTGYYQFNLVQRVDAGGGSGNYYRVMFRKNNSSGGQYDYGMAIYRDDDGFAYTTMNLSCVIYVTAGQYIDAAFFAQSVAGLTTYMQRESVFSGHLIG